MRVELWIGPSDQENIDVFSILKQVSGVELVVVSDTKVLEGVLLLPFVQLTTGERFFGLESIKKRFPSERPAR
jgi:hypothetical protein